MSQPPGTPYGPPPPVFPPPAAPPPGRGAGPLVLVLIVAVVVVLVLIAVVAGYLLRDNGDGAAAPLASVGPVDLREPLVFRLVAQEAAPPCQGGAIPASDASACFTLGPDTLTVRRLDEVRVSPPDPATGSTGWSVSMTLTSADTAGFADLTRKAAEAQAAQLPAGRMAMLVGGSLVSDPAQVLQPITGGQVEINGPPAQFTRAYTEGIVRRMTGR